MASVKCRQNVDSNDTPNAFNGVRLRLCQSFQLLLTNNRHSSRPKIASLQTLQPESLQLMAELLLFSRSRRQLIARVLSPTNPICNIRNSSYFTSLSAKSMNKQPTITVTAASAFAGTLVQAAGVERGNEQVARPTKRAERYNYL